MGNAEKQAVQITLAKRSGRKTTLLKVLNTQMLFVAEERGGGGGGEDPILRVLKLNQKHQYFQKGSISLREDGRKTPFILVCNRNPTQRLYSTAPRRKHLQGEGLLSCALGEGASLRHALGYAQPPAPGNPRKYRSRRFPGEAGSGNKGSAPPPRSHPVPHPPRPAHQVGRSVTCLNSGGGSREEVVRGAGGPALRMRGRAHY